MREHDAVEPIDHDVEVAVWTGPLSANFWAELEL